MNTYRFPSSSLQLVIWLTLAVCSHSIQAASGPGFYFDTCLNCSDAMFSAKARNTAPIPNGSYPVYIVDNINQDIRFFTVVVWTEDAPPGVEPKASSNQRGFIIRRTYAIPGIGDPEIIATMQEATAAVNTLIFEVTGELPAEELGLIANGVDSAVDLIGPETSIAGLNRNVLRNSLTNHIRDRSFSLTLGDFLTKLVTKYFLSPDAGLIQGNGILITFPDGTSIQIALESVTTDIVTGQIVSVFIDIMTNSIQGPGLPAVPQNPGQLNNFRYPRTGESGEFVTAESLAELAQRLGSTPSSGGGGSGCTFACAGTACVLSCTLQD